MHPRPQAQLSVSVVGRYVEVVDASIQRLLYRTIRHFLRDIAQSRGSVDEHRAFVLKPSEPEAVAFWVGDREIAGRGP